MAGGRGVWWGQEMTGNRGGFTRGTQRWSWWWKALEEKHALLCCQWYKTCRRRWGEQIGSGGLLLEPLWVVPFRMEVVEGCKTLQSSLTGALLWEFTGSCCQQPSAVCAGSSPAWLLAMLVVSWLAWGWSWHWSLLGCSCRSVSSWHPASTWSTNHELQQNLWCLAASD